MASFLDKLSSILTNIVTVELEVESAVPVLHVGTAGDILGYSIVAEESLIAFLAALKSSNMKSVPVMAVPPPVAPTA